MYIFFRKIVGLKINTYFGRSFDIYLIYTSTIMSINRKQFLRRSLAGSAAIVVGKDLGAVNPIAVEASELQGEETSPPPEGNLYWGCVVNL